MSLKSDEVTQIAWLARLSLDEQTAANMTQQLSKILDLVDQMNAVNTDGIVPLAHPMELTARLRDDAVTEQDQHERFQASAPAVANGLYLVPKVIE